MKSQPITPIELRDLTCQELGLTKNAYTIPCLSAHTGVGKSTLWRHAQEGLVTITKVGGRTFVLAHDAAAYLNRGRRPATRNAIAA